MLYLNLNINNLLILTLIVLLIHDLYFFIKCNYNIFEFISIKNRIQINLIFE